MDRFYVPTGMYLKVAPKITRNLSIRVCLEKFKNYNSASDLEP